MALGFMVVCGEEECKEKNAGKAVFHGTRLVLVAVRGHNGEEVADSSQ
jgi:hypothetical protein